MSTHQASTFDDRTPCTRYALAMHLIQCSCVELAYEYNETGQLRTVNTEQLCQKDLWKLLTPSEREKYDVHIPHILGQGRMLLVQVNASGNCNQYQYVPGSNPRDMNVDDEESQLNIDFAHFNKGDD
jgi:hypothetical protein